ncbi:unnamed protein product, partial [Iphiclides podalirius]
MIVVAPLEPPLNGPDDVQWPDLTDGASSVINPRRECICSDTGPAKNRFANRRMELRISDWEVLGSLTSVRQSALLKLLGVTRARSQDCRI